MNERIKWLRQQLDLTQVVFAEKINVSQNFVWMIEKGNREPSDRTIKDICRVFNVNESWLRDGIGEPFAEQPREAEMTALFKSVMADRPDSFRTRLITALLRFEPNSPEWALLESIYNSIEKDKKNEREP